MKLSLVICSFNRYVSLEQTLQGLEALSGINSHDCELIVVDNNSTDITKSICQSYQSHLPLKYVLESRQGKSHALNRALQIVQGDLIAFTDDDVDVDPQWIYELCLAADKNSDIDVFGGPVYPKWESPPPSWYARHALGLLEGVSVHYDRPLDHLSLEVNDSRPFIGANLMIRRKVFERGFRFREDLGPKGDQSTRSEESVLIKELLQAGHRALYVPTAIIYHRTSSGRTTERYVRSWFAGNGRVAVRLGEVQSSRVYLWGAPRYLWRKLMVAFFRYAVCRWTRSSDVWLRAEIDMATTWGMIEEFRNQTAG